MDIEWEESGIELESVDGWESLELNDEGWRHRKESEGETVRDEQVKLKWVLLNSKNRRHDIINRSVQSLVSKLAEIGGDQLLQRRVEDLGDALIWAVVDRKDAKRA